MGNKGLSINGNMSINREKLKEKSEDKIQKSFHGGCKHQPKKKYFVPLWNFEKDQQYKKTVKLQNN